MRTTIAIATLFALSCGSADSKSANSSENGASNAETNNATNAATNNATTNNGTMLEVCSPDTSAPARLLGLVGIEVVGEAAGVVTAVAADQLTLEVDGVAGSLAFEGGDLSELFRVDDDVTITVTETEGDFETPGSRVQSIAGPRGIGAEIGWSSSSGFDSFVSPSVALPLAAATATFGERLAPPVVCGELTDCGVDEISRSTFAIDVTYRAATAPIKPGEDLLDDEYSFHWVGASVQSHSGAESGDCVSEGGSGASLRLTAWGRVFL